VIYDVLINSVGSDHKQYVDALDARILKTGWRILGKKFGH